MTIRAFTLALYSASAPIIHRDASREDHLNALTHHARIQLDRAFHDGRHQAIRPAARFLLDCHSMLNRWQQYREAHGPTPAEQSADREWLCERQAMMNVMKDRPDIFDLFMAARELLMQSDDR